MRTVRASPALSLCALLLAPTLSRAQPAAVAPTRAAADKVLAGLSVEQKVGQLMMVGFAGTEVDADVEALLKGMHVGGVCLFKRNIVSAAQVAQLNDAILRTMAGELPPFLAVDQEGGNVVRIDRGAVVLPGNMALGATRSRALAYEAGKSQGESLKRLGFNMNLAPVLDVNVNPKNPVIGIRSFSDQPALVGDLGLEFVRGQQEANVTTVAKHFPGHGNTDADSHRALPVMLETESELLAQIGPFSRVIQGGLDGLMTAHVAVPKVSGNDLPATLSPQLIGTLLRKRLGFDGLVLTDELEMDAIAQRFGVGKAAVMAIAAGSDMVLIPWRPEKKVEVHTALLEAVKDGALTPARLDEAVRRVLIAKHARKLFEPLPPLAQRLSGLGAADKSEVPRAIARASVTLLRADAAVFPLRAGQKVAVLTAEASLGEAIKRRAKGAKVLTVSASDSSGKLKPQAKAAVESADVVVVGILNARQLPLVSQAAAQGKPVIAVAMGLPYVAEQLPAAKTVLAVYSYRADATEAAAAALFGEEGTPGKLPVALKAFPFGHGLNPVGDAVPQAKARP